MDLSSLFGTLLSSDALSGMSQATNTSTSDIQSVLGQALPSLMNGALSQAEGADTLEGFTNALSQHGAADTSNLTSFLGGVDLEDGAKIVNHLLGAQSSNVQEEIAQRSSVSKKKTMLILAAVAPLLMSMLGKETNTQQTQNSGLGISSILSGLMGGGDMGNILSGLLGGNAAPAPQQQSSGGFLASLFGKLFK